MIHGWLNLDKTIGISSAQAVAQVKKFFVIKKLVIWEPLTLWLLVCCQLPLVKRQNYTVLILRFKGIQVHNKMGRTKNHRRLDGDTIKTSSIKREYNQINCAIKNFVGDVTQTPPQFSAIKINRTRAYRLARSGQKANI